MTKITNSDMFVYASFYSSKIHLCPECKSANKNPIRVIAISTFNKSTLIKNIKNLKNINNSSNKNLISIEIDSSLIQGFFEVEPSSHTITTPDIIKILQPGSKTFSFLDLNILKPFTIESTITHSRFIHIITLPLVFNISSTCTHPSTTFRVLIHTCPMIIDLNEESIKQEGKGYVKDIIFNNQQVVFTKFIKVNNYNLISNIEKVLLVKEIDNIKELYEGLIEELEMLYIFRVDGEKVEDLMCRTRDMDNSWVNCTKTLLGELNIKYLNCGNESIKVILKLLKICCCSGIKFIFFFEKLKEFFDRVLKFKNVEVSGKYKRFIMNSCPDQMNIGIVKREKNQIEKLQINFISLFDKREDLQMFGANVTDTMNTRILIVGMAKWLLLGLDDIEDKFIKALKSDIESTRARGLILKKK